MSERQESLGLPIEGFPAWLAGIFEIGSSLYFKYNSASGLYCPGMEIVADSKLVNYLCLNAGGWIDRKLFGSPYWTASNEHAAYIAEMIIDFAPSREGMLDLFIRWGNATYDEKEELAIGSKSLKRFSPVEIVAYEGLCFNQDFVAGILDSRAKIHESHLLTVNSQNTFLLYALKKMYGGSVSRANLHRTYRWTLQKQNMGFLMNVVEDRLRVKNK